MIDWCVQLRPTVSHKQIGVDIIITDQYPGHRTATARTACEQLGVRESGCGTGNRQTYVSVEIRLSYISALKIRSSVNHATPI